MSHDPNEIIDSAFMSLAASAKPTVIMRGRGRGGRGRGGGPPPEQNGPQRHQVQTAMCQYYGSNAKRGRFTNNARQTHRPFKFNNRSNAGRSYVPPKQQPDFDTDDYHEWTDGDGEEDGNQSTYFREPAPYTPPPNKPQHQYNTKPPAHQQQPVLQERGNWRGRRWNAGARGGTGNARGWWNDNNNTTGGGGGRRRYKQEDKSNFENVGNFSERPQVHLPAAYIKSVKDYNKYRGTIEIVCDVYAILDSDVRTKAEYGRKEFQLRDRTGSQLFTYYEIDTPMPFVERGSPLKVACVWRHWGLQAVKVEVPDVNYVTTLENKIRLAGMALKQKLESVELNAF